MFKENFIFLARFSGKKSRKLFRIVQHRRSSSQFQDFSSIILLSANVYSEGSLNSISLVNVSARAYSATPSWYNNASPGETSSCGNPVVSKQLSCFCHIFFPMPLYSFSVMEIWRVLISSKVRCAWESNFSHIYLQIYLTKWRLSGKPKPISKQSMHFSNKINDK